MMNTQRMSWHRPFDLTIEISNLRTFWKALNLSWWFIRLPMFLLVIPASWGVGSFAHQVYPLLVAALSGGAFEALFIGAIATADQQNDEDLKAQIFWWLLNIGAVFVSALINILHAAGGTFKQITPESIVHGAPFAVLNFLYALLLHRNMNQALQKERVFLAAQEAKRETQEQERRQREAQAEAERKEYERMHAFKCICGEGKPTQKALNGHKASCRAWKASRGAP